ncbi:hypothetical protein PVT67_11775 [Gallaecimonas kandeliae]|uniref:hypothetical protein n=1 Tax=Gallaecimonas kandeliae TaxID=3029055 RepID=UPI0026488FD2|nr:hypothetical protein [Gallaecimonas kandeliae]WKE64358.1 hypothetical protein PVT67_11775 [Gallaecimonas kandeliae]
MEYVAAAMSLECQVVTQKGKPVRIALGDHASLPAALAAGAEQLQAEPFADVLLCKGNKRWLVMPAQEGKA